ncbi:hypothetical protein [Crenobacter cavernae]|uniref:Alkaline phytoceramidase n=1 Tax=Crenobacter cavernae TaxID=2290923 RepID=A0ABY0FAF4_9NEIS|nr:hypothetical protein [Crenobacter cavernae]RXZ42445.1 hypothetical protein EBB06_11060 [Crenobacter cavernae]
MKTTIAPRPLALIALAIALAALTVWLSPLALPAGYHAFADRRALFGLPNAADVLSNAGFALVGILGLAELFRGRLAVARAALPGYALFFAALVPTALGSAWYHLAPDDARLFWDQLPIVLAAAGLLSATLAEALRPSQGLLQMMPTVVLSVLAALVVLYGRVSGDLAPYVAVHLALIAFVPLLQALYPTPVRQRFSIAIAIAFYLVARACELADLTLYDALGFVSGHTLKHLFMSIAALAVWRGLPHP